MANVRMALFGLAACVLACSRAAPAPTTPPAVETPNAAPAQPPAKAIERGPKRIAIDGDPNGILWDAESEALLVADGDGHRILRWTDADGWHEHVRLPGAAGEPGKGGGLGQLVRLPDGTLVVVRFGHGDAGGILTVARDGNTKDVPGLDPTRRRIGIAVAPDGALYTAWFGKHGEQRIGGISRLELAGRETDVMEGLQKPVGLVVLGASLLVADQRAGHVLRAPLTDLTHPEVFVRGIEEPDLLCLGPRGAVVTGGKNGQVRLIEADGSVTVIAEGFSSVRGVTYDAAHARLFIAEHDMDESDGIGHAIHLHPLG